MIEIIIFVEHINVGLVRFRKMIMFRERMGVIHSLTGSIFATQCLLADGIKLVHNCLRRKGSEIHKITVFHSCKAVPLTRLKKEFKANGVNLSGTTMANWIIMASQKACA